MVLATLPIHRPPKVPTLQSITKPIIGEIKAPHTKNKASISFSLKNKIDNTPHWQN